MIIQSGSGFWVDDLYVDFDPFNNIFGEVNNDININNVPCDWMAGDPSVISGCVNIIPSGPGDYVPPDAFVVIQTSNEATTVYDFSAVCGMQQCVYVIKNACTRTVGAFSNHTSTGLRYVIIGLHSGCSESIIYDTDLLTGGDGDYFIPPDIYGQAPCASAPPVSFGDPPPLLDAVPDLTFCGDEYILPQISGTDLTGAEAYYTGSGGAGISFVAGEAITMSGSYYVFDGIGACSDEVSFDLTIDPPQMPALDPVDPLCDLDDPVVLSTVQDGVTGTWSGPGVSSNEFDPAGLSGTVLLTFTPDAGQCASEATTDIDVFSAIDPQISGVPGDLCQNDAAITLPTIQDGIPGNWSGPGVTSNSFDPAGLDGSISLTFTPDAGECAHAVQTIIIVDEAITPQISGVPGDLCQTDAAIALPTTQDGIPGNWSGPGVTSNSFDPAGLLGIITLQFTPDAGECAIMTTYEIQVMAEMTPQVTGVPTEICAPAGAIALPPVLDGYTGQWSGDGVSGNMFDPAGLNGNIALLFTPDAGQCAAWADHTITVFTVPTYSNVTQVCDPLGQTYTVTFDITSGDPASYMVNGEMVGGSTFVSDPIPSGTAYFYEIDDANNCGPAVLAGSVNCACAIHAGTMDFSNTPLMICVETGFTVIHNGDEMIGTGDVLAFFLHDDPGAQLGSVFAMSNASDFPPVAGLTIGQIYYVSAVAGADDGSGNVDLNDPCLAVSQGVPVVFYGLTVEFTSGGDVCASGCVDYLIEFTGDGPFLLNYQILANGMVFDASLMTGSSLHSLVLCPADYSISYGTIDILPIQLFDAQCDVLLSVFPGLEITVFEEPEMLLTETLCSGNFIIVNGTVYDTGNPAGVEIIQGGSTQGCDSSIVIDLSFHPEIEYFLSQTLCTGGSLTVNGNVYDDINPSGTEVFFGAAANGCDSTVHIQLMFDDAVTFNLIETLCPDGFIVVNSVVYDVSNPAGTETYIGGSALGCDSIVQIDLSFYPDAVFDLDQTLCTGGSITINGTIYDETNTSGTEILPGASAQGCDSTIHISLGFSDVVTTDLTTTLCAGESIIVNGNIYDAGNPSGVETITGGSVHGCDSVVTIDLSFFPVATFDLISSLCRGDQLIVNGNVYDQGNPSGMETLVGGSALGCDSIISIMLTFYQEADFFLNETLCTGGSITVNGVLYDATNPSGIEILTGASVHGCDSTIFVDLSFSDVVTEDVVDTLCPGDFIVVNGVLYNEDHPAGTEVISGGSAFGCDSVIHVQLSFYIDAVVLIDTVLPPGGGIVVNGVVYDQSNTSGVEIITGGSTNGCDSTIIVMVHFESVLAVSVDAETPVCHGGSDGAITIFSIDGGSSPYTVSLNDGLAVVISGFPHTIPDLPAGFYGLRIVDSGGNSVGLDLIIADPPLTTVDAGPDRSVPRGSDVQLMAQASFNVLQWHWTPPDFLSCTDCPDPVVMQPSYDITYLVTAIDADSCVATDLVTITVLLSRDVFVPSVFTPNGDGINDLLILHAAPGIDIIQSFRIFNRWGELMHEVLNSLPNDFSAAWDGTYRGKAMEPGVYVWIADVRYADGVEVKFSGDVTLIR